MSDGSWTQACLFPPPFRVVGTGRLAALFLDPSSTRGDSFLYEGFLPSILISEEALPLIIGLGKWRLVRALVRARVARILVFASGRPFLLQHLYPSFFDLTLVVLPFSLTYGPSFLSFFDWFPSPSFTPFFFPFLSPLLGVFREGASHLFD